MVKESEFKNGKIYTKCGRIGCDEWYTDGDGCPIHNPWKDARKKPIVIQYRECNQGIESIQTREGTIIGGYGHDYIIKGIEGELYPIKKDIFEKTYDSLNGTVETE